MRHFILTRSSYGPEWSLYENQRRLNLLRGITAKLMRAQTIQEWTWVGLLDERDELFAERERVFDVVTTWDPSKVDLHFAPWGQDPAAKNGHRDMVAATAYEHRWPVDHSGWATQTRLDDDDGLAPDFMARMWAAAGDVDERCVLEFPVCYYIGGHQAKLVVNVYNATQTLVTPPGDTYCVYDYPHRHPPLPVHEVDREPGWLWVRHPDTLSRAVRRGEPFTDALRAAWPIDWSLL